MPGLSVGVGLDAVKLGLASFIDEILFCDQFGSDQSAPITSPRVADPGPGTGTAVQAVGQFSTASGLIRGLPGVGGWGDLSYRDVGRGRTAGIAAYFGGLTNLSATKQIIVGHNNGSTPSVAADGFFLASGTLYVRVGGSSVDVGTYTAPDTFDFPVIKRTVGFFAVARGEQFAEWTLLWVDASSTTATQYAALSYNNMDAHLDAMKVAQLLAPWNTDYGIATDRLAGARTAGDTFVHEADCLLEFTVDTLQSAGFIELFFRVQDASNYWKIRINTGGTSILSEVVSGAETDRASGAGVVNGSRGVIVADDETIKYYVDDVLKFTYSGAVNFKNATAGEVADEGTGGEMSDVVAWPRTLSGDAGAALDELATTCPA